MGLKPRALPPRAPAARSPAAPLGERKELKTHANAAPAPRFGLHESAGCAERRRGERELDSPPSKQRRVPRTVTCTCYAWVHVVTSRGPGAAKDGRERVGGRGAPMPMPMWRSFDQSWGSAARHSRGAAPARCEGKRALRTRRSAAAAHPPPSAAAREPAPGGWKASAF